MCYIVGGLNKLPDVSLDWKLLNILLSDAIVKPFIKIFMGKHVDLCKL